MDITFGKHEGKTVAELVIKEPKYVNWILDRTNPSGPMALVIREINRLINIFDSKPFISAKCSNMNCSNPVSRLTVYGNNIVDCFFCS